MKACSIDGCEKKHYGHGWCQMHYRRWTRTGTTEPQPRPAALAECSIPGCERTGKIMRGWCSTHYNRWLKHGDPLAEDRRSNKHEAEFLANTEPLVWSGCLIWTGPGNGSGYGLIHFGGRAVRAHRYAWERQHGPIPEGMQIDHQCWNRACVNIDHLRLATHQENQWNRSGAASGRKHDLPRGVHRRGNKYRAIVGSDGRNLYFGTFSTVEETEAAVIAARKNLHGAFAS